MDQFISRFKAYVKQYQLFEPGDKLLIAVSGGMDSAVLAACCQQSGYEFTLAHANFQLREGESDRDEAFVESLSRQYQKKFRSRKFQTTAYAGEKGLSIQTAARDLRYTWFESILEEENCRFILTAHHLDDNIETMLMHFFRGTGIAGLRGILPKQGKIRRPLLPFSKAELAGFATEASLAWVEDSSNASDKYTRNYFRHKLIPDLEIVFPEVRHNLQENLKRFAETEILYHQAIAQHKKRLMKPVGAEIHIPVLLLKKAQPQHSILHEMLKPYGFSAAQVPDAIRLLDAENGRFLSSGSHRLIRNRSWLILAPAEPGNADHLVIESGQRDIDFIEGKLLLKQHAQAERVEIEKDPALALLDADKLSFPLMLRKWQPGDYFYPLGMRKKKKIARFLIDQKISKTGKEKIWVLESDRRILWVVGHRIDDRFCVSATTRKILKIELRVPHLI